MIPVHVGVERNIRSVTEPEEMDKDKKTIDTYDKIARHYSDSHFDHFWTREFEYFKSICPGKRVIDVGCGAGRDASVFVDNGFDYVGIDASQGMLDVATERVKEAHFLLMSFYELDFPPASFDGFWAAASLLHVPKLRIGEVLENIHNIIKSGGVGFISIKEKREQDEGFIEEDKYGGISRYFAFYTNNEFVKLLEQSRFEIVKLDSRTEDDERKTRWLEFFVRKSF